MAAIAQRLGGAAQVQLAVFDLADLSSVRRGATELLELAPRLDVLVNNAGLVLTQRAETVDGFEATFATNHLGPFLLTNLLLERIRASAPSRIVNVASTAHSTARSGIPFDDLQSERHYRPMRVYGQSKLANMLFTLELARRLEGSGVTANSLHPGHRAHRVRRGRRHPGPARIRDQDRQSLLSLSGQGCSHLGLSRFLPRGGGCERGVLRQVQAEATQAVGAGRRRGASGCGR